MLYRKNIKNGDELSALGFGVMRVPTKDISNGNYENSVAVKLLREGYEKGINYFDTAYVYMNGENEKIVGVAVKPFRDKIKIATKLPLDGLKVYDDFDKHLNKSLERLQTNYIDYYLLHCILSFSQYEKLCKMGIMEWLIDLKNKGVIKNIGFSFHGQNEDFKKIIDAFDWDFCQIQYNWIDVNHQAGRNGLQYANSKGIPVIIMEPLHGGQLTDKVPAKTKEVFDNAFGQRSLAENGLRFVLSHSEVTVVLSGMRSQEMLDENIRIASNAPVGCENENMQVYETAMADFIASNNKIPCTGCSYCMPCPKGVNIPKCFSVYNDSAKFKVVENVKNYVLTCGGLSQNPTFASQCVGCGRCEKLCPQHIEIRKELKKVKRRFELPLMGSILRIYKNKKLK